MNDDFFVPQLYYWGGLYILLGWWCLLWFIAQLSGWATLAKTYRATPQAQEEAIWEPWGFGKLNLGIGYKGCLWVGFSPTGLLLKTGPDLLFRFAHPPLLFPWEALTLGPLRQSFWGEGREIRIQDVSFPLTLKASLLKAGEPYWPPLTADFTPPEPPPAPSSQE